MLAVLLRRAKLPYLYYRKRRDNAMRTNGWQTEAIAALTDVLKDEPNVRALVLFGSAALSVCDVWSDIDLLLVVEEQALKRFFPTLDWLQARL